MRSNLHAVALAVACLAGAVILPLASLRTENEASRPPVVTLPGADSGTGLFPALWTAPWPGLATLLGVLLPIVLLSIGTYILVRRLCGDDPVEDVDTGMGEHD